MTSITRDLIRGRAEHNNGEIFTLEELSLHQRKINKIENIDRWCPNLKILYLQGNNITKIENLGHLKQLEYLNLALNQIESMENLMGCESLEKLDLTANCIWKLSSCYGLQHHHNLRQLYLMGNPCTKYTNYRSFVIGVVQQLEELDGQRILHTDRLAAKLNLAANQVDILRQEDQHQLPANLPPTIDNDVEAEEAEQDAAAATVQTKTGPDGRILNSNRSQIPFTLEQQDDRIILTIKLARHIDNSLVDVDVQPTHIRVLIKGHLLQLVLPAEVQTDLSLAQRSLASGHLAVTMPTVEKIVQPQKKLLASKNDEKMDTIPHLEPIG